MKILAIDIAAGRDEDACMASGHGLFYLEEPSGIENLDLIAITGPNREILDGTGLELYYPNPGGHIIVSVDSKQYYM